jgi:hypothetical protein
MDASRKTAAKNPESENDRRDPDKPEARKDAAAGLLSPAMPPAGAGAMLDADPRLDDRSETEQALERAADTNDPADADRHSGDTKKAGA